MLEPDTQATAEQALRDAFASDEGTSPTPSAPSAPPEQAPPTEPSVASEGQPGPTEPESFTKTDLNSLLAGITDPAARQAVEEAYKSFQGDYTRKTQEIAPLRNTIDAFGGVDQVQEALGFVQALQDPENLVQFHSELSTYLQQEGYTKAEADAAASGAIADVQQGSETDDFGFEDPRESEIQSQLEELRQWREQIEEERLQANIELGLERQEAAIRNANPHYSDDDIERIYRVAYAFGGDLDYAQQAYEADRQAILASYAQSKESVPVTTAPPTPNVGAAEADSFGSDFDAAHDYAKRLLAARAANGEF